MDCLKDIVIVGAGGFGREVQWIIESINEIKLTWNLLGYIDNNVEIGTEINGYPVLGGNSYLLNCQTPLNVVMALGNSAIRKELVEIYAANDVLEYPNIIHPNVLISNRVDLGKGNIICAGSILTVDIEIGDFNIINLMTTIGHDVVMKGYVTIFPTVNVSGNVILHEGCHIGTGTQIIEKKTIGPNAIIGAGAVVVSDIDGYCTAVGCPAKPIKYNA